MASHLTNALRNNPKDLDTKYNLAYAQKKLDEQEEQQDQNQDQNKERIKRPHAPQKKLIRHSRVPIRIPQWICASHDIIDKKLDMIIIRNSIFEQPRIS